MPNVHAGGTIYCAPGMVPVVDPRPDGSSLASKEIEEALGHRLGYPSNTPLNKDARKRNASY